MDPVEKSGRGRGIKRGGVEVGRGYEDGLGKYLIITGGVVLLWLLSLLLSAAVMYVGLARYISDEG